MITNLTSARNCSTCEATMKKGAQANKYKKAFVKNGKITHHEDAYDCMYCLEDQQAAAAHRQREEDIEGLIDSNFY